MHIFLSRIPRACSQGKAPNSDCYSEEHKGQVAIFLLLTRANSKFCELTTEIFATTLASYCSLVYALFAELDYGQGAEGKLSKLGLMKEMAV